MTFRPELKITVLYLTLVVFNVGVAALRLHKRGVHDLWGWFQLISWCLILLLWSHAAAMRWTFEPEALVKRRPPFRSNIIPYAEITSVDSDNAGSYVTLTLGGEQIFRQTSTAQVRVGNMPAFLEELERHVRPDVMHT